MKPLSRYLLYALFFIIFLTIGTIFTSQFFLIGKTIVVSKEDIHNLSILNRRNLILLDQEKIKKYLLESNPFIKSLTIEKKYPNTLLIKVIPREPSAVIKIGSVWIELDSEGILLRNVQKTDNLLIIEASDQIILRKKPDWRIIRSLELLELLKKDYQVSNIQINDKENVFKISFATGEEIIIPYNADTGMVVASLQIIIHRFRIEGKTVALVDFRFDKPVVRLINEDKNYTK